jgi:hypothetical protein
MMTEKDDGHIEVSITVPSRLKIGTFANAFRVLKDTGEELLLDFCVYSEQEQEASVVSRLRVHRQFLLSLLSEISTVLQETAEPDPVVVIQETDAIN